MTDEALKTEDAPLTLLPQQPRLPADREPLVTVISRDRVPVTLYEREDGGLTILVGGRVPVELDRWQTSALVGALVERG